MIGETHPVLPSFFFRFVAWCCSYELLCFISILFQTTPVMSCEFKRGIPEFLLVKMSIQIIFKKNIPVEELIWVSFRFILQIRTNPMRAISEEYIKRIRCWLFFTTVRIITSKHVETNTSCTSTRSPYQLGVGIQFPLFEQQFSHFLLHMR